LGNSTLSFRKLRELPYGGNTPDRRRHLQRLVERGRDVGRLAQRRPRRPVVLPIHHAKFVVLRLERHESRRMVRRQRLLEESYIEAGLLGVPPSTLGERAHLWTRSHERRHLVAKRVLELALDARLERRALRRRIEQH